MSNIYNKASIFTCVANSRDKYADITIQSALVAIKRGELNVNGTLINIKELAEEARLAGKPSDKYNSMKKYNIPAITWASRFNVGRNKDNGFDTTGCQYFDADSVTNVEEAKTAIANIPYVKAVWTSLSGKGIGGIIYTETNDVQHMHYFIDEAAKLGIEIDKAVKDIASRLNTFSYDPDMVIKNDKDVVSLIEKKTDTSAVLYNQKKTDTSNLKVDGSKAHRIAYKYTSRRGLTYTSGEKCAFITSYAGLANQFGLDFNDMCNEISTVHPDFDFKRAKDIYDRYGFQFGSKSTESVAYTNAVKTSNTLKEGQYLSDILTKEQVVGKYLIAPTGSGKSRLIAEFSGKKVMIVPTQALSEEFAREYNGKCFNQYNKDVTNTDNLIFVTYSSYCNLLNYINISEYDVFCDEVHVFVTSAERSFMHKELLSVINALENGTQKSTTLCTATPVRFAHPYLQGFETLKVVREVEKVKELYVAKVADRYKFVSDVFNKAKANKGFVTVLLNNTKDQLDNLTASLSGHNFQTFSASQKTEDHFVELIKTGTFNEETEGIISTTVLGQGNSFKVGEERNNVVYVITLGSFSPAVIEQFACRVRDSKKVVVISVRAEDYQSNDEYYFDGFKSEFDIVSVASESITKYKKELEIGSKYSIDPTRIANTIAETHISRVDDTYVIDYLLVGNTIYNEETAATRANVEFFAKKMTEYNYEFKGEFSYTVTFTEDETSTIKVAVNNKKDARKAAQQAIVNTVKAEGLDANRMKVESNEKMTTDEATVRYRLDYIYKYEQDDAKVFAIYNDVTESTQAWTTFEKQILVNKVKTDSKTKGRSDREFINDVYNVFTVGTEYTSEEVNALMQAVITNRFGTKKPVGKTKTTQILRYFFGIEVKQHKINGDVVRKYKLTSDNPCPVTINSDSYIKHKESLDDLYARASTAAEVFDLF